jgi:pyruvate dehydrogenase E2 component (dihydrolipoamide acetyltransferase)
MTDLLMPKLGLTMTEGVLLEWKVAPGEAFAKGQLIFVVESDKAATDIEAEADGVMAERLVQEGETVPVGTPVARLAGAGSTGGSSAQSRSEAEATKASLVPSAQPDHAHAPRAPVVNGEARIVATPLARRLARERGIDLTSVAGSGPRGRIKAVDLERAMPSSPAVSDAKKSPGGSRRMKPTPTQSAMARRLSQVKHGVPHFYLGTEVEVSRLAAMRAELNSDAGRPRLTVNHFVLAAVGRALAAHPGINRVWDDGEIVAYDGGDVAMAVETETGLYVPVVRDCATASLDAVASAARSMIARAKAARLSAADMEGAAVAVSNAGMHDVTWLTPIINAGQSAIIGVGSIREVFRPGADGRPVLKREMGLVFSGDHRVHTGVEGLGFLNHVKATLENPLRLMRRD